MGAPRVDMTPPPLTPPPFRRPRSQEVKARIRSAKANPESCDMLDRIGAAMFLASMSTMYIDQGRMTIDPRESIGLYYWSAVTPSGEADPGILKDRRQKADVLLSAMDALGLTVTDHFVAQVDEQRTDASEKTS